MPMDDANKLRTLLQQAIVAQNQSKGMAAMHEQKAREFRAKLVNDGKLVEQLSARLQALRPNNKYP